MGQETWREPALGARVLQCMALWFCSTGNDANGRVTMTLVGALLGILGVALFARWLLIGGDDRKRGKR